MTWALTTVLLGTLCCFTAVVVVAVDKLDPDGGVVLDDGDQQYIRMDKDGRNVKLGEFDPEEIRIPLNPLTEALCKNKDECRLDIAAVLLFPEEYIDAIEISSRGEPLEYFLSNLYAVLDVGVDVDGDATGEAGDGLLSKDEISNRVYGTIRAWQEISDRDFIPARDRNDDDLIDMSEFTSTLPDDAYLRLMAFSRFEAADKNKDGWLADIDVKRFRHPLWEGGKMHRWAINTYLLELDADEDGILSRDEFLTGSGSFVNETIVPASALESEFTVLDVDGNEFIDLVEINKMPQARVTSLISMAANSLFAACDADGDNNISVEELEQVPLADHLNSTRVEGMSNDDDEEGDYANAEDSYEHTEL